MATSYVSAADSGGGNKTMANTRTVYSANDSNDMDGGASVRLANYNVSDYTTHEVNNDILVQTQRRDAGSKGNIYHANNLYSDYELDVFNKRFRYGLLHPYRSLTTCREYVFFTKPDLNIIGDESRSAVTVRPGSDGLTDAFANVPFWVELKQRHENVIKMLQYSYCDMGEQNPFNNLLGNMLQSNLDVPGISADLIESPNNMYGVGVTYRGSSEASNDTFDFSLEFKDTKDLPVYHFFRAYEEYETVKHHGSVGPWWGYIENKVLHDQYSIYKFLVDEDGETILYYCKYYGVKSKSLPRDTFSSTSFDNGLSYSIDFNAAFFEDMDPLILVDFNRLASPLLGKYPYWISPYNVVMDRGDMRPARVACIVKERNHSRTGEIVGLNNYLTYDNPVIANMSPGGIRYKLKWKGDDQY